MDHFELNELEAFADKWLPNFNNAHTLNGLSAVAGNKPNWYCTSKSNLYQKQFVNPLSNGSEGSIDPPPPLLVEKKIDKYHSNLNGIK